MRQPLCDAIANLLELSKNQKQFGNRHMIIILKKFLQEQTPDFVKPLTKIIYNLSLTPSNCVVLHHVGIASVRECITKIITYDCLFDQ